MRFDDALELWREGERRAARSDSGQRATLERIVDALVEELRRRLGGPFTSDELARLYTEEGTDWCFAIAVAVAPDDPEAWDMTTAAGAAFARYLREASDYGGGRRREEV